MQEEDTGKYSGLLNVLTLAAVVAATALGVWAFASYRKTSLLEKRDLPKAKENLEKIYTLRKEIYEQRHGQEPPAKDKMQNPMQLLLDYMTDYNKKGIGKIDSVTPQPARTLKKFVETSFRFEVSGVDRKSLASLLFEIEDKVFFLKVRDINIEKFEVDKNHSIPKAIVTFSYYVNREGP